MRRWAMAVVLALLWVSRAAFAAPVLVDADWVQQRLGEPGFVVVDMSSEAMQYQRFHIPGAVYLPYSALVERRRDGVVLRRGDSMLLQLLGRLGIDADTHVIVYDDMGGLNAGRLFWELEQIGHPRVSILDGGLVRWVLDGRKVDNRPVKPAPKTYVPAGDAIVRANGLNADQFKAASGMDDVVLLDVRTEDEYRGNPKGKRTGHVPGARWWPWEQAVRFDQGFVAQAEEPLLESLAAAGVESRDSPVVLYCRTGHRASQTYMTLRRLGFDDVRVYDGSMAEYQLDQGAPLVRGKCPLETC